MGVLDISATHASLVSPASEQASAEISRRLQRVGALHRRARMAAKNLIHRAREIGDELIAIKSVQPEARAWGAVLQSLARDYGLAHRTAQLYVQIAANWDGIQALGVNLEQVSMRGMQRLLAKPRSSAIKTRHAPPQILAAVLEFFGGVIDFDPFAASVEPDRASARREDSAALKNVWSGRVFAYPSTASSVQSVVERAVGEYATQSIDEAVLLLPATHHATWTPLLDARPRVYLRQGVAKPGSQLLAGVVERQRFVDFGRAFSRLGPVFFPYESTC